MTDSRWYNPIRCTLWLPDEEAGLLGSNGIEWFDDPQQPQTVIQGQGRTKQHTLPGIRLSPGYHRRAGEPANAKFRQRQGQR